MYYIQSDNIIDVKTLNKTNQITTHQKINKIKINNNKKKNNKICK